VIRRRTARLLLGIPLLAGCSSGTAATVSSTTTTQPGPPSGPITVLAAASLTKPFDAAAASLAPVEVRYSYAGSQSLVTQLTQGAPADVVALADDATMGRLVGAGLVDAPVVIARNTLVIAVAPGNPKAITGLADLARPDVTVVLAEPSVPAGGYAKQALDAAHVRVSPKSLELDVKATLGRVETGEADAAIVYGTDVRASTKSTAVAFPEAASVVAAYPIAIVKATGNRRAAEAFVASAQTGSVHDALVAAGFTT
jgi:molybdate transport system substrate-binding protein